jgi:hypothetical protein
MSEKMPLDFGSCLLLCNQWHCGAARDFGQHVE